jgi:hypothetical protein
VQIIRTRKELVSKCRKLLQILIGKDLIYWKAKRETMSLLYNREEWEIIDKAFEYVFYNPPRNNDINENFILKLEELIERHKDELLLMILES